MTSAIDKCDSEAACRHCGCAITCIDAGWVDARGFFACVKGGLPGSGRGPVLHEPMPATLRGAAKEG